MSTSSEKFVTALREGKPEKEIRNHLKDILKEKVLKRVRESMEDA